MSAAVEKHVYRADRRNAARSAGTLNKWRTKARVRTKEYGMRSREVIKSVGTDGVPVMEVKTWRVFTYAVAA